MTGTAHSRKRKSAKRGTAALEYGMLAPVLFLFIIGIMDMGRLMWVYAGLSRAVEAGARCGAVDTTNCATTAQIQSTAAAAVWGMTVSPSAFGVSSTEGIRVTASYSFKFFTPGFTSITLSPSACYVSFQTTSGSDDCR
jgi:Flp pilus assembly protein TadG